MHGGIDRAFGGILLESEDTSLRAARWVTAGIAVAVVDGLLEDTRVPAHEEVSVVAVASGVTVREDERLLGVQRILTVLFPVLGVPVHLQEDTWQRDGELGIIASTTVRPSTQESNMALVVGRIGVLAVPA